MPPLSARCRAEPTAVRAPATTSPANEERAHARHCASAGRDVHASENGLARGLVSASPTDQHALVICVTSTSHVQGEMKKWSLYEAGEFDVRSSSDARGARYPLRASSAHARGADLVHFFKRGRGPPPPPAPVDSDYSTRSGCRWSEAKPFAGPAASSALRLTGRYRARFAVVTTLLMNRCCTPSRAVLGHDRDPRRRDAATDAQRCRRRSAWIAPPATVSSTLLHHQALQRRHGPPPGCDIVSTW